MKCQLAHLFGQETSAATIISIVESLCQRGMLHGALCTSSSSAATPENAIYTPRIYSRTRRRLVDSFYETNGYLTAKKCAALGLSRNRMEGFVRESFVSRCRSSSVVCFGISLFT